METVVCQLIHLQHLSSYLVHFSSSTIIHLFVSLFKKQYQSFLCFILYGADCTPIVFVILQNRFERELLTADVYFFSYCWQVCYAPSLGGAWLVTLGCVLLGCVCVTTTIVLLALSHCRLSTQVITYARWVGFTASKFISISYNLF